jgi:hypothetical protein
MRVQVDRKALDMIIKSAERKTMLMDLVKKSVKKLKKDGLLAVLDIVWGESTQEEKREWLSRTISDCAGKAAAEMVKKKMGSYES